ncbi:O-antigen ligase family protein [Qipengyuania sp. CAU 1752]
MTANTEFRPQTVWVLLLLLTGAVAFLGGSSRSDAAQLMVLRPLSAIFLMIALYNFRAQHVAGVRWLVFLLISLAILMLVQVIPLPPEIWHRLPGRQPIVAMDAFLGFEELWRPLSLNPWRAWNALASLVVPAAALLLALAMRAKVETLLILVAGMGALDAMLGLLQVATGSASPFYFYEYSNRGSPIGIFANENHSAIFSACSLLVLARLTLMQAAERGGKVLRTIYPIVFVFVLVVGLVSSSRAGFLAIIGALVTAAVLAQATYASRKSGAAGTKKKDAWLSPRRVAPVLALSLLFALPALFIAFDSVPAFNDIFATDPLEDLRWQLLQVSLAMMADFWTTGIGFGAYEQVYHIYEPTELLRGTYVNQAHNDWAQLVIEGGVVAIILLGGLLAWIGRNVWLLGRGPGASFTLQIFWSAILLIIALASVIDYPLRAPAFQLAVVWLLLALALDVQEKRRQAQRAGSAG